ncbi:MAG: hypothetical protein WCV91_06000 [Candidatus Margulisiibacteriota bacterium]
MKYYLLDASAFIYAIENLTSLKHNFFLEHANGDAFLYMPQFCVTEVLNCFAKFFYRSNKIGEASYVKWKDMFLSQIRQRKVIYCYDLHRYHNINIDKIIELEHKTPYSQKEGALSSFDILIIAMGMELKRIHPSCEVNTLTRDGRLLKISNIDPALATAIWLE